MPAYYNENDPKTAAWLRELIKAGLIADGEVDTRSIELVQPGDVHGFRQCHFFSGIGGWSHALRLAGWPDTREVWTGSCPCQPFSSAGAQAGGADPRHLWPAWFRLICECRPRIVFGEQVESAIAHGWLDLVCDDLEGEGYAVGACGLSAASVGAPHIRARLWFVAQSSGAECGQGWSGRERAGGGWTHGQPTGSGDVGLVAVSSDERREGQRLCVQQRGSRSSSAEVGRCGETGDLGDTSGSRLAKQRSERRALSGAGPADAREAVERAGAPVGELAVSDGGQSGDEGVQRGWRHVQRPEGAPIGFWSDCDWIPCRDGRARPVEPGTFPLAYGIPARVGRLRGYGNAIVPQVAAAFIAAYLDCCDEATDVASYP